MKEWFGLVARLVTGGVWIVAGALKLPDPYESVRAVRAYALLPEAVVPTVGMLLPIVEIVLGVVMVLLGLAFAGLVPFLQRDVRVHTVPAVGLGAAPVLGFLFGLGWTPCVGPTLAAIITLGINEGTAGRGALLAAIYCFGLGLPFIVAALAYRRALGAFGVIRRHQQWVTRLGGAMLVLVGLALLTGYWDQAVSWLQIHLVEQSSVAV